MPPVDDGADLSGRLPQVEPSAPMELMWLGHHLLNSRSEQSARFSVMGAEGSERLSERLRSFWGDGVTGGTGELLVLADSAGLLFAENIDELLSDLPVSALELPRVLLRFESPSDRGHFIERLTRLQREPEIRRRYAGVLRDLWEPMRPEWELRGLPEVRAACKRAAQRLDFGAPLDEVVPALGQVTRKKAEWQSVVSEATEAGRLVLNPSYFGGRWSMWDLPDHVVVGFGANSDPLADARTEGNRLAPKLRALGDPTRLAILLYLAERPTSVGELARRFGLAQPTVSAHLRGLRGAELVAGKRSEGRTVYHVEHDQLVRLLQDLADSSGVELRD
ncbi:MAG TPA: metalloregulator ArsR/SmtB family transcription factor [Candidatus Acidoferrales bacterium]|nr:metalloregulator ArsR/SmtB family transcription factor [Candidatus Acidoferrales bacterium]HVC38773.1 metalloregulator ArsR/SmtB family transcription factor [Candidatus Dormibacteraeota bacterium]